MTAACVRTLSTQCSLLDDSWRSQNQSSFMRSYQTIKCHVTCTKLFSTLTLHDCHSRAWKHDYADDKDHHHHHRHHDYHHDSPCEPCSGTWRPSLCLASRIPRSQLTSRHCTQFDQSYHPGNTEDTLIHILFKINQTNITVYVYVPRT